MVAATQEYRTESDSLRHSSRKRARGGAPLLAQSTLLHNAYLAWCSAQGMSERERLNMTNFGREMRKRFDREERRTGNFYLGVGLRSEHDSEPCVEGSPPRFESDVEGLASDPIDHESLRDREVNREQLSATLHTLHRD